MITGYNDVAITAPMPAQLYPNPMDKMVAVLADDIFKCVFLN